MAPFRLTLVIAIATSFLVTVVAAQQPLVPREFYKGALRHEGNQVSLCLWMQNPIVNFDRAVGEALASALLAQPAFYEYRRHVPFEDEDEFWQTIFILLQDHCSGIMGIELAEGVPLPDWVTISRPYLSAPYVLAVKDNEYRSLGNLPAGARVGSPIYTVIDQAHVAYVQSAPRDSTWRRLPYDSVDLAWDLLDRGVLAGAIFWAPVLAARMHADPQSAVRAVPIDPLPAYSKSIGILMLRADAALRTQIDAGLRSLADDGELERISKTFDVSP